MTSNAVSQSDRGAVRCDQSLLRSNTRRPGRLRYLSRYRVEAASALVSMARRLVLSAGSHWAAIAAAGWAVVGPAGDPSARGSRSV
jgi:hypothetical protein